MPSFWWVSHNQTASQEIEGQYLWSPKTNKNGARNEFYRNMRRANPGDVVLSFFDGAVRYIGRVAEFAFTAPKPAEFGSVGSNWNNEGWLLPVFWTPLDRSVRPADVIGTLGPLLPKKYSPVSPETGDGYQGVYLASIPEAVYASIMGHADFNRDALARGGANSLTFEVVTSILEDEVEHKIREDLGLESTVRESVIQARRGQGKFRSNVEFVESACRLTGISNPSLLIASHIKPWRVCSSAAERLDGMNGLLLTPDADLLFDRGFISFQDSGEVMVSERVDRLDLIRLGFEKLVLERFGVAEAPLGWRTDAFTPDQCRYLAHHRSAVFISPD